MSDHDTTSIAPVAQDIARRFGLPDLAPVVLSDDERRETPEERHARLDLGRKPRLERWERRLPFIYRNASLDDITDDQDPDGRIRAWWDSEALNLALIGKTDVGKTHLAYAIGNHVARDHRLWAVAWYMPELNEAMRPEREDDALAVACEADLLIIDDLGRENLSPWTLQQLTVILNARGRANLRTIVTTNLEGAALIERYGDPVVSRISDRMHAVHITSTVRRRVPAPW